MGGGKTRRSWIWAWGPRVLAPALWLAALLLGVRGLELGREVTGESAAVMTGVVGLNILCTRVGEMRGEMAERCGQMTERVAELERKVREIDSRTRLEQVALEHAVAGTVV